MEANKEKETMDVKCPEGLLLGYDWGSQNFCENGCPNSSYYECKDKFHSCVNKADFGSEIIAKRQARLMACQAYFCKHCGGWHIGRNWNVGF